VSRSVCKLGLLGSVGRVRRTVAHEEPGGAQQEDADGEPEEVALRRKGTMIQDGDDDKVSVTCSSPILRPDYPTYKKKKTKKVTEKYKLKKKKKKKKKKEKEKQKKQQQKNKWEKEDVLTCEMAESLRARELPCRCTPSGRTGAWNASATDGVAPAPEPASSTSAPGSSGGSGGAEEEESDEEEAVSPRLFRVGIVIFVHHLT
jgi:hypothetical protein